MKKINSKFCNLEGIYTFVEFKSKKANLKLYNIECNT